IAQVDEEPAAVRPRPPPDRAPAPPGGPAAEVPLPRRLLPACSPAGLLCAPPGLGAPAGLEPGAVPGLEGGGPARPPCRERGAVPGLLEDTQSEGSQQEAVEFLRDFCDEMGWPCPRFSIKSEGDRCLAMVEMAILGVYHTFSGQLCEDAETAEEDVAERVLWYLRAPGREDAFEPDRDYARKAAQLIPGPPTTDWVKDGVAWQDEVAERKTTIMLVQNRLQQIFSSRIETGMRVWHWSYERGGRSGPEHVHRMIRATVTVPLAGRQFVGNWMHGQRDAQIDTCSQVIEFLNKEYPQKR
ncbi:unnamed protein product, partial [Prorocentrum cordatum]